MVKMIVAGHRMARPERHGELIAEALSDAVGGDVYAQDQSLQGAHMLVHGGNPLGGLDDVAANIGRGWGWTIVSYGDERSEAVPGTGVGNYAAMTQAGADLVLLFPGLNDSDSREAELWAIRRGIRYRGYPLTSKPASATAAAS